MSDLCLRFFRIFGTINADFPFSPIYQSMRLCYDELAFMEFFLEVHPSNGVESLSE